ncbi:MAG: glycosyltransferase family 4 protein [Candidatus Obscuribacter sp.]|nr:glycosyltransferase family 4 protein [Candidatus Obscuribacter sp.]MBP6350122.1 glycosyltransferase family 4 protein [Candidatus Obscuribacter sp.]MBP6592766.1 glycosyltransferase family 4 protein [Candidatus Obscuribacter sp.]MBP7577957.1 glycosyltransferase family 4 protein [Candidatus Obscuribacter sp.]
MPKRVLMLSWEYPPRIIGGLARVVWALSRELVQAGVEVHVVTADHPGQPEHCIDDGVHVHRVKTQTDTTPDFLSWVNRFNFGLLQYAIKLHQQAPFDIIHAHDWMVTDAAWVLKSGFDIPFVATMHATEAGRMHGIHNDLQRYIHQMEWRLTFEAWEVIVNSHSMNAELQNSFGLPPNKIAVVPNGTDPTVFDFEYDARPLRGNFVSEHEQIVLYVGRMVREKGVHVMLEAVPRVIAERPGTQFIFVGTGYYLDDLKKQAEYMGVSRYCHFLGYVGDEELKHLYKAADAVCIPSLYEPFGIVALEGMAAQVPVVTSDVGGLKDFVEHMETGVTTYAGDAGSLAWGLLQVLRNPELADKLRQCAYDKVQHIYNWKVIARRTLEVYQKVLKEAEFAKAGMSLSGESESKTNGGNTAGGKSSGKTDGKDKKSGNNLTMGGKRA